jgi:hypothetical protein
VHLGGRGWLECPQPVAAADDPGELTVAAWIKVTSLKPRGNHALVTRPLGAGTQDYFFFGFTNGRLRFHSDAWKVSLHQRTRPESGWHHVAFTRSSGRVQLYVGGKPVGQRAIPGVRRDPVTAPLLIGGGTNHPGVVHELFDGSLDEVVLYDRALADQDIAALAAGTQPRLPD